MVDKLTVWLDEIGRQNVPLAGGKGANLGDMVRAGLDRRASSSLQAVRTCWSSLFTSQAIFYRAQQGFDDSHVSMVRSLSDKELREVYMVRGALESLAARLAAERLADGDLETLRGLVQEMVRAGQEGDALRMIRLDNRFHEAILRLADDGLLYQLWQTLRSQGVELQPEHAMGGRIGIWHSDLG